jgi:hypothetical protein
MWSQHYSERSSAQFSTKMMGMGGVYPLSPKSFHSLWSNGHTSGRWRNDGGGPIISLKYWCGCRRIQEDSVNLARSHIRCGQEDHPRFSDVAVFLFPCFLAIKLEKVPRVRPLHVPLDMFPLNIKYKEKNANENISNESKKPKENVYS